MRILSVSHYAPPHVGGLETIVGALAAGLSRRGHEVTVVASTAGLRDELGIPMPRPFDYRMLYVPAWNKFFEVRVGVPYPFFSPALVPVLRREVARADVVHVHGILYQSSLAALALARRAPHRPVTVLTEHVGFVRYRNPLLNWTERCAIATLGRWSARAADVIVVFNRRVEEIVARLAPGARIRWIDNGIDTEFFRPASSNERERIRAELRWDDRPRVLFGGRAVAKKGLPVALDAARHADGAFTLAVVGTMQPPADAPWVERLGLLSRERMAEALRAADALLVPSHGEGVPMTIQEALASGIPVVASDDPGYSETLAEFGDAVRLTPADGSAMAAALDDVLSNPRVRASAQAAVEVAHRRFSIDACVSEHERLYAELCAGRGGEMSDGTAPPPELEVAR